MCCRRRIERCRGVKGLKKEISEADIPIYLCLLRVGRIEVSKKEGLRIGRGRRIWRGRWRAEERDWEE